ncbi:hypothetical protein ACH44C_24655 [Streptomyces purpureus]|uniref:hypothetical protein n=1 Tax=Streptomyces purpureus TaxID=1951 RepID=UPI0037AE7CBA
MTAQPHRSADHAAESSADRSAESSADRTAERDTDRSTGGNAGRSADRSVNRTGVRTVRRGVRLALAVVTAVLALPLVTAAATHSRAVPYGDRLTAHTSAAVTAMEPALRVRGHAVEAYDPATGHRRWTYTREGRHPLAVLPLPGHALALWSDGMVTDTVREDGSAVRWHRVIPAFDARSGSVLQPLDPQAKMLAVVTPERIAAYRVADGDLRWILPPRRGCTYVPQRHLRTSDALLIAQPCTEPAAWTAELVAVDEFGRIEPDREPLGNEIPTPKP